MKAYTDIEQSKKLAEILPIESADMFIADIFLKEEQGHSYNFHFLTTWGHKNFDELKERKNKFVQFIPCWSLAALLNAVDFSTINLYYNNAKTAWVVSATIHDSTKHCTKYESTRALNPVDACYELIIKLNEQKLI